MKIDKTIAGFLAVSGGAWTAVFCAAQWKGDGNWLHSVTLASLASTLINLSFTAVNLVRLAMRKP